MTDLIPDIVLQDNTSQRLPCVLVLDGSSSMYGEPIDNLNEGLKVLEREIKADDIASMRVQLLVIRIGGMDEPEVVTDWTDALDFTAPKIEANGTTPLGAGVNLALKKIDEQKKRYKQNQIPYNVPWLFVITDGCPTDLAWDSATKKAKNWEEKKKVVIFPIGTQDADFETLSELSAKNPVALKNLQFSELFVWLSKSVSVGSQSAPGGDTQLPAMDWGSVPS